MRLPPRVRIFLAKVLMLVMVVVPCAFQVVFADDVGETIKTTIINIALACEAVIVPLIILGLALGYVQVAGPWGLQTVKKSGRGQIEIGIITLVLFAITPVLVVVLTGIAAAISGGCTWETLIQNGKC
jgi:hypothetical protein